MSFLSASALKVLSMKLVPPNGEKVTGSAIKVVSMELVPPDREKMTGSAQYIDNG